MGGREGKAITCAGLVRALNLLKYRFLQGKDTQRSFIHSTNTNWRRCRMPSVGGHKGDQDSPGLCSSQRLGGGETDSNEKVTPPLGLSGGVLSRGQRAPRLGLSSGVCLFLARNKAAQALCPCELQAQQVRRIMSSREQDELGGYSRCHTTGRGGRCAGAGR